jgi:hypothetical protein
MGAHPYWYFVPYDPDLSAALERLRQTEFRAGRYNPVVPFLEFPLTPSSPAPGAKHRSIEAALKASDADGTRSILDIDRIADEPDFSAASPLSDELLEQFYGTTKPTRAAVEANMDFFEDLDRGQAIYIVLYDDHGHPSELFFAGYSFD